jgi:putative transposase
MKTSRFSDAQIIAILKQAEVGAPVPDLCREHGISTTTFYKWRTKFGGMDASLMARLKELEDENRRLKKCMLRSASRPKSSPRPWQKSGDAICPSGDGDQSRCSLHHLHPSGLPGVWRQ